MASSPSAEASTVTIANASSFPTLELTNMKLEYKARRFVGADSTRKAAAVVYSPPAESPCRTLATTSTAGAATPIWAYVGAIAMSRLPTPIMEMLRLIAARRPWWSANRPIIRPAIGRARNPAAKTPKALNRGISGDPEDDGKNWLAK